MDKMKEENSFVVKEEKTSERKTFVDNSPLYSRMSVVCHVVIFLYAAAFWIQVGVFPYLSKKLGVNTVMFGYLRTASAVAMLIGGPLFGRIGDLYGAKICLLVSFIGSALSYIFLAIADGVGDLLLSSLLGFFMNAMQAAQMVITDVTGTRDRATALGRLTVAYGIGMIVGPTMGGWITSYYNDQFAAGAATILVLIAVVIVIIAVPTHTKDPKKVAEAKKHAETQDSGSIFNIKAITSLLSVPVVLYLIILKTVVGIPAGVFHSMFSVVNIEKFDLTPEVNGYLLTYIGVLTAIMQGAGIKVFTERYPDTKILKVSIIAMAFSYLLLAGVTSLWILVLIMIPMVMSGSLMNTIASSTLTKKVPETDTGTSIGLNMATHALIRSFSPTAGAYLYLWFGYPSFGLLGFILNGAVAAFVFFFRIPGLDD